MYQLPTTTDEDRARELIEEAMRALSVCDVCGRTMQLTVRDGALWVECASLGGKHGLRLALATGFHESHRIELPEGVLAAA